MRQQLFDYDNNNLNRDLNHLTFALASSRFSRFNTLSKCFSATAATIGRFNRAAPKTIMNYAFEKNTIEEYFNTAISDKRRSITRTCFDAYKSSCGQLVVTAISNYFKI